VTTPMTTPTRAPAGGPPRGGRGGRVVAAVLAVVGGLLVLAGAVGVVGLAVADSDSVIRTFDGVDRLVVDAGSGELSITGRGGEGGGVDVELRRRWSWRAPRLDARVEGGTLHLDSGCRGVWLGGCDVRFRIQAPAGIPVLLRTGSGNVTAAGMRAGVELRSGSGDVRGTALAGPVLARTSSGDVQLTDVTGEVTVDGGSGDVSLEAVAGRRIQVGTSSGNASLHARAPAPELVTVRSGSGNVDLVVPGEAWRVETSTGSGNVDVRDLVQDPDAPRRIQAISRSGDVTIRRG
jgi:hypothetical protein